MVVRISSHAPTVLSLVVAAPLGPRSRRITDCRPVWSPSPLPGLVEVTLAVFFSSVIAYGGGNCRALSRSNIRSLSFPALSIACMRASQLMSIHSAASVVGCIINALLYLGISSVLPVSGLS
eukprot:g7798.t1